MACDGAAGGFLLTYAGHKGGVGLQFAVDFEFGTTFLSQTSGLHDLVHHFVLGRTLGGEAEHGNARVVEASNALSGLSRADGNLRELVGIGHGRHGHITYDENAILAVLRTVGDEEHSAADAGNTRGALDDLECGAQRLTRGGESTGDLSVGTFGLDDHATEVERVLYEFAGLFDGHALALAEFAEELCEFLGALVVLGVDERSLADVGEAVLLGQGVYFGRVADEDDVGQAVCQSFVGRDKRALFLGLGEHYALRIGLRTCDDFFNQ